jgi:hypothetical protein
VRSRADRYGAFQRRLLAGVATAMLFASSVQCLAAEDEARTAIREAQVGTAVEKLRADPNLATTRQVRTLRWIKDSDDESKKQAGWLRWLVDLFTWFAEVGRVFVWLVIALLAGLLVLYLVRFAKAFERSGGAAKSTAPTHVRDLDIRPESLPDDIGSSAWALWERGENRGALSLLYRGLLSRLAHVHEIPIRDSSTEGDCLALAERHLPTDRRGYVAELIRTWQRAVYGGEDPQSAAMRGLCDRFSDALRPQVSSGSAA